MAEYLRPDVYVEEKSAGARPIPGVSTSTAAMVIVAPRGPVGIPQFVTSWTDVVNTFSYGLESPFLPDAYGAYSLFGFFNNGGSRAWVVRVTDGTETNADAVFTDGQASPVDVLKVSALDAGTWGNKLSVLIKAGSSANLYNLSVMYDSREVSVYTDISLDPTHARFVELMINGFDKFVSVTVIDETKTIGASNLGVAQNLTKGKDGSSNLDSTMLVGPRGLGAFDSIDDINLVVIPESQTQATIQAGYDYCAKRKYCDFIADGGMTDDFAGIQALREKLTSPDAALYFPWIEVSDPIAKGSSKTKWVPVGGHVAGVIARIDSTRGVHKAPAGLEAVVRGALSVKVNVKEGQHDVLNPKGINVIRAFPNQGIVVWGARTLASDPKDTYINVRRELKKIMKSLLNGTKWAVFEPNNEDLWRKLNVQVKSFLLGEFALGAFKGETPAEAFFVKCDSELNPQSEIDAGRVNMEVGVAINKPGEFVIIRVGQWDGGASASV